MNKFFRGPVWLALPLLACRPTGDGAPFERTGFLMDTLVRVRIWDRGFSAQSLNRAADRAFSEMQRLEGLMSVHSDTGDVVRAGRSARERPVAIHSETAEILRAAKDMSERSGGAFDVTIGPLKELWPFDAAGGSPPDPDSVRLRRRRVGHRFLRMDGNNIRFDKAGMALDLGGIAKGHIVDRAVEGLKAQGIRSGMVEAGGDLRLWGTPPGRSAWRIGVKHPRPAGNDLIAVLETPEAAVATSGDYERCFFHDGKRYHHILDPATGYPAGGCVSVTVVAPTAMLADACATAVFVLGPRKGLDFLKQFPDTGGLIFFDKKGRLEHLLSADLAGRIAFEE